jgi:MSHA biogenesis protein MshM
VNILAHKALLLVFGEGAACVERRHVVAAIGDTPAAASAGPAWWPRLRFTRATD